MLGMWQPRVHTWATKFNLHILTSGIFLFSSVSASEVRLQLIRTLWMNKDAE
jgi:hypothetical protein